MDYDQDFEDLWNSRYAWPPVKKTYYEVWQAAKATKSKKQQIELEGGDFLIAGNSTVAFCKTSKDYSSAGHERKTKEDAKKAAEAMRRRDRLAAFVYEHCGFEGEWDIDNCNCFIYYDISKDKHKYAFEDDITDLCKQYMPEATAKWLCEKLNSGEIVL